MIGAIIGDLAGSIYEYNQTKKVTKINCKKLLKKDSFISDDTILTMAILNAILTDKNYEKSLKIFGLKYENMLPKTTPYFKTVFSPNFTKWLHGNFIGTSTGNGSIMRISPIGYLCNSEKEIEENVFLATAPSHNSPDAINAATIIAKIIFYARQGIPKKEIINKLNLNVKKLKIEKFNFTCKDTIDVVLYSLFKSNSFEESIKTVLSFGGDTDTNACIVGSMAEAMFGISPELKNKALYYLPDEFKNLLIQGYKQIDKNILSDL